MGAPAERVAQRVPPSQGAGRGEGTGRGAGARLGLTTHWSRPPPMAVRAGAGVGAWGRRLTTSVRGCAQGKKPRRPAGVAARRYPPLCLGRLDAGGSLERDVLAHRVGAVGLRGRGVRRRSASEAVRVVTRSQAQPGPTAAGACGHEARRPRQRPRLSARPPEATRAPRAARGGLCQASPRSRDAAVPVKGAGRGADGGRGYAGLARTPDPPSHCKGARVWEPTRHPARVSQGVRRCPRPQ